MQHLVLEDEVPDALEALIDTVAEETGASTEIEARLARRLAIALWKSERAEKIETALFDAAPKIARRARLPVGRGRPADHLRRQTLQCHPRLPGAAGQGDQPLPEGAAAVAQGGARASEPEDAAENKPKSPPAPANDDARPHPLTAAPVPVSVSENKPEPDPWDALPAPVRAELERLLAAEDWPGLAALGATGALQPLGLEPADLASPAALGRALSGRPPPETRIAQLDGSWNLLRAPSA